jgi:hypothetical protein
MAEGTTTAPAPAALPVRTQVLDLKKGWNAVWLEVEPLENDADKVFAGQAVDVCARYFRPVSSPDYIRNPAEKPFNQEGWAVWYAPSREEAVVRQLGKVNGHAGYLVHATQDFRWSVTGTEEFRPYTWKLGSFTLAGFPVDAENAPTFASYFAGSGGKVGSQIYRLVDGRWQRAALTEKMRAGEACWIYAEGETTYQGPITIEMSAWAVDFGSLDTRRPLTVINTSGAAARLSMEVAEAHSTVVAGLPVAQSEVEISTLNVRTAPLAGSREVLDTGEGDTVHLVVQRGLMTAPVQTALLKISDGVGSHLWVPVRAEK